jgi:hypothetical protein
MWSSLARLRRLLGRLFVIIRSGGSRPPRLPLHSLGASRRQIVRRLGLRKRKASKWSGHYASPPKPQTINTANRSR